MQRYCVAFAAALPLSLLFTFVVREISRRRGWVAKPRADRWHKRPTALLGGTAIFGAFAISWALGRTDDVHDFGLIVACSSCLFLLGLVDDFVQLSPITKLIGQIAVAALFTTFGLRLHWLPLTLLDQAVTVVWLVGITNAVNLLDNMDGLAGGVSAIAAAYLTVHCDVAGEPGAATLAAALTGSLVGFLVFNFNPASIFMGDCGSLFLGFTLAALALVRNQPQLQPTILSSVSMPVLLLFVPILDTSLVAINRAIHERRISQGGRDHSSHRLIALGLSERGAVLTLWVVGAASGGLALSVPDMSRAVAVLVIPLFALALIFFFVFVGQVTVYQPKERRRGERRAALVPVLANFSKRAHIFEVSSDLVVIALSYYAAYLLRFDGQIEYPYYDRCISTLPIVVVIQLSVFVAAGVYRRVWRYISTHDVTTLFTTVTVGWAISTGYVALIMPKGEYSRTAFVIYGVLVFSGVVGTRYSLRLLRDWLKKAHPPAGAKRVIIYGAGDAGELLLREIQNNRGLNLFPVGFIDDDPRKQGSVIHGVRVLGPLETLYVSSAEPSFQEVVVSIQQLGHDRIQLLDQLCASRGLSRRSLHFVLK